MHGQLALLVPYQWPAEKRASTLISSGPLGKVRRIRWFEREGAGATNSGQHHHAWLFWDCRHGRVLPPGVVFAD